MLKLKLTVIAIFLSFAGFAVINSKEFSASAENDIVQEIANYKTWRRINKEPIKVDLQFQIDGKGDEKQTVFIIDGQEVTNFRTGELAGWNNLPFEISREERNKNQKDLVGLIANLGKQLKNLIPKKLEKPTQTKDNKTTKNNNSAVNQSEELPTGVSFRSLMNVSPNSVAHNYLSFGVVYANDLAKDEIRKEKPNFAVGSIIVREKNASETSETPELVIAMVKREKGFSSETNDWEFLVFNGKDLQLQKRETKGDCAACHIRTEKSDWVFRDYLK